MFQPFSAQVMQKMRHTHEKTHQQWQPIEWNSQANKLKARNSEKQSNRTNAKNDKVMLTADKRKKNANWLDFYKFKHTNQILSLENASIFAMHWIRGMHWRFWCIINAQKRHHRSISFCLHCQKRHNFRMLMQSIIIDCKCEFFVSLSAHSMGHFDGTFSTLQPICERKIHTVQW